jgi:hypothetical protein
MSLYNMLHGCNKMAGHFLQLLGLVEGEIERFRDVFVKTHRKERYIVVYTRTGGGSRDDYPNDALTSNEYYVRDHDDAFDPTYAHYYFRIPDAAKELVSTMADDTSPTEKWKSLFEKLERGDLNDPEVKRALDVGREIMGKVNEALKNGGGIVEV